MTEFLSGSNQRVPEYHTWVALCGGVNVRSYVELGCGSAHWLRYVGANNKRIVTVDLLPNGLGKQWDIPHVQGNSHDPETLKSVLYLLGEEPDAVFIDADHELPAVRQDFELWWPVTKMLVGFHDILMPSVAPFWEHVALRHRSVEIIARDIESANAWQHPGPHPSGRVQCGGIGVLFKQ